MPKKGKRAAQKARAAAQGEDAGEKAATKGRKKGEEEDENEEEGQEKEVQENGASEKKGKPPKGKGKDKEKEKEKEIDNTPKGRKPAQFTDIMAEATSAGTSQFTIKADDFSLGFQGKSLLENTSVTLAYGRRYGLVGINGSGKSTLIRAIAKREIPGIPKDINILHVEQEVEGDERTPVQSVIEADTERTSLLKEQHELDEFLKNVKVNADDEEEWDEAKDEEINRKRERLQEVYGRLAQIGAHNAESRASAILTGLQFTERMKSSPTKELSGGWRMRIALARALFCRPHLLLLDEPTNHLDLFACIWFETFLSKWKKSLLIVSHDIDMLNTVCTDIIYLNYTAKTLEQYRGNYDHFLEKREEKRKKHEKDYENQQKEIKRLRKQAQAQKSVAQKPAKAGAKKERGAGGGREKKNTAAKNAKSAAEQLENMVLIPPPEKDYRVKFAFPEPGALPHPVLQLKDASFKYPPKDETEKPHIIFEHLELGIGLDTRIALVGPNGAGKSTLLNLLTGALEPTDGEVVISRKLKMAKFNQHTHEQLELDKNPCELLMSLHPGMKIDDARRHLGRFGITGKTQVNKIETLSGGQRSRVVFAILTLEEPHILMMDEPTNNLDIESIEALCSALREFKGGVVLVTHDQNLIAQGCNRIWCIDGDKKVTEFPGDFYEYQKRLISKLDFSELEDLL